MKTTEAWADRRWHDSRLESEFTCFDEDKPGRKSDSHWDTHIGTVHQIGGGPGGGMWLWSVTATFPGPRYFGVTSGREISRKEAGRCVVECYERMLAFYSQHCPRT